MVFPMKCIKTAQYHDATNNMRHLIFSQYFPWNHQNGSVPWCYKLPNFICILHLISHKIHPSGSVPRCYKWQTLSQFFMVIPMEFTKAAQYHNATNDARYLIFFVVFSMQFTKTTQYHDATNNTRYLICHDISHEIHQNGSVPRCYK